nr:hypothetical protein [Tanacetum cinerariifolium]
MPFGLISTPEIQYHPGKASVAIDALSRNKRAKPLKVRALVLTINSNLPPKIHKAQVESLKKENVKDENLHGITAYVSKCLTFLKIRDDYQKPSGLLVQPEIPHWKRENIAMDFITRLPKTTSSHATIWKFMAEEPLAIPLDEIQVDDKLNFIEEPVEIMDREVKRLKQSRILIVKVRHVFRPGPVWGCGTELVQETTEKISQIKDRLKAACGTLWEEREVCTRFVGHFEITKKVGLVAYRLDLPEELNGVHDTFHVSNLKKCLADPTLQVPEIRVDAKLNFVEEPVEILEREFKKLKWSRIVIVKILYRVDGGVFMRIMMIYGLL